VAKIGLKYVKTVQVKGKQYLYFDSGDPQKRYARLPDAGSMDFGTMYAAYLAVRTKQNNLKSLVTFAELASRYQLSPKYLNRSQGTQRTYLPYIIRMIEKFDDWPAADIDRADIRALLSDLQPGAQLMQLAVAKNIFGYGVNNDLIEGNPTKDIKIDHESAPHEPWPDAVIEKALLGPARLPVALLYFTGQRIGDVCKMRWSDIDDGVITVVQQKTGKELYVPVHSRLEAILAETPRSLTTIVCNAIGKPYSPSALRKVLRKHVGDYVPHGLRKNAVNALLEAGCSAAMVSAITGQTMQIVEMYAAKRNNRKLAKTAMGKWNNNA
jgi:integrase